MSKTQIKRKINNLLDELPEDADDITIYYVNPFTQEKTLLYQSPAAKAKHENHEQIAPETTDR
jgi:hypothetical protein